MPRETLGQFGLGSVALGRLGRALREFKRQLPLFNPQPGKAKPVAIPSAKRRKTSSRRRPTTTLTTPSNGVPTTQRPSDSRLWGAWQKLVQSRFPERVDLLNYSVHWSKRRQRRTLASCCVAKRRVVVARELNRPEHYQWIEALLYHEMCHAVLGDSVGRIGGKRAWHGPQFKHLERLHEGIPALNRWIKEGGWARAVRSDRGRASALKRKHTT